MKFFEVFRKVLWSFIFSLIKSSWRPQSLLEGVSWENSLKPSEIILKFFKVNLKSSEVQLKWYFTWTSLCLRSFENLSESFHFLFFYIVKFQFMTLQRLQSFLKYYWSFFMSSVDLRNFEVFNSDVPIHLNSILWLTLQSKID